MAIQSVHFDIGLAHAESPEWHVNGMTVEATSTGMSSSHEYKNALTTSSLLLPCSIPPTTPVCSIMLYFYVCYRPPVIRRPHASHVGD